MTQRFRDLTLVADGDGYILGNRHADDYVAVPRVGGLVVQWLQDGCDLDECARRAEEHAGEAF
ncbi:hypothetical protein AB0E63_01480 [Kribbella sp. NPDC026596]|uniref:hypothetical protein n=1 Tax=Kribbella sp. NPDC026596 TaxID=3155122 RepID=UPI00340AAF22